MKCEDELNDGRTLLQIVEKLPEEIKKRWLTVNYEEVKSGCLPKLDDVISLVESEASKQADPIFANLFTSISQNSPASSKLSTKSSLDKKRQTFATELAAKESTTLYASKPASAFKCPNCAEEHFLNQCQAFRALFQSV